MVFTFSIYLFFRNPFLIDYNSLSLSFRLGHFIDANVIFLRFPFQNRTFLVRKPYVFGSETVRFWDGERKRETA